MNLIPLTRRYDDVGAAKTYRLNKNTSHGILPTSVPFYTGAF